MEKAKSTTKTTARAKKTETAAKPARAVKAKRSVATEDDIRMKAQEIYHDRISKGMEGTAEDDWIKAEKQLKG